MDRIYRVNATVRIETDYRLRPVGFRNESQSWHLYSPTGDLLTTMRDPRKAASWIRRDIDNRAGGEIYTDCITSVWDEQEAQRED
jgi:hypothetical protein